MALSDSSVTRVSTVIQQCLISFLTDESKMVKLLSRALPDIQSFVDKELNSA